MKNLVKKSKILYFLYYYTMSLFVNILKLFVRTDNKLILFVSYGGRHYSDSPRVIYEAMLKDERYKGYKLVWGFVNSNDYPEVENKIKIDTLKYYKTALRARCWVTNVMIERALNFKGKHTYYFFTTHGVLLKCDGPDLKQYKFSSRAKMKYDCCLAQSEYEKMICQRMFQIKADIVKILGYPKDDILVHYTEERRNEIRKKLGIPEGKKAVLYAPTYREEKSLRESFNMDVEKWRKYLSKDYVLLYRAHPIVSTTEKVNDDFFIDCTKYEMVEDLMIATDMLISDYSGIIFDFCIMHKPIYLWTYDYEEYNEYRGLYFDIRKELKSSGDETELLKMVASHDWSEEPKEVYAFQEKYETVYGNGTINSLNDIYENIQ